MLFRLLIRALRGGLTVCLICPEPVRCCRSVACRRCSVVMALCAPHLSVGVMQFGRILIMLILFGIVICFCESGVNVQLGRLIARRVCRSVLLACQCAMAQSF